MLIVKILLLSLMICNTALSVPIYDELILTVSKLLLERSHKPVEIKQIIVEMLRAISKEARDDVEFFTRLNLFIDYDLGGGGLNNLFATSIKYFDEISVSSGVRDQLKIYEGLANKAREKAEQLKQQSTRISLSVAEQELEDQLYFTAAQALYCGHINSIIHDLITEMIRRISKSFRLKHQSELDLFIQYVVESDEYSFTDIPGTTVKYYDEISKEQRIALLEEMASNISVIVDRARKTYCQTIEEL